MNRHFIASILALLLSIPLYAQTKDSVEIKHTLSYSHTYTWHTKYDYHTRRHDAKIRIFDVKRDWALFEEPSQDDHRIRCLIDGNDSVFFVSLFFDGAWEYIEESDVRKMTDAIDEMNKELDLDKINLDVPYFENWYTTDDGVRIGYVFDRTLTTHWELFRHDSDSNIHINKKYIARFAQALKDDLEEIKNIRNGKILHSEIHHFPQRK